MAQLIKALKFTTKGKVYIEFNKASASANDSGVVNKNEKVTISDLTPHPDFKRALEKFAAHLTISIGFHDPVEYVLDNDPRKFKMIDKQWFDTFQFSVDPRFKGIEVTGILVNGKEAADAIRIIGTYTNPTGGVTQLKSPLIEFIKKNDGTDYKLLDILTSQYETLVTEAENFYTERKFEGYVQGDLFYDNVRKVHFA